MDKPTDRAPAAEVPEAGTTRRSEVLAEPTLAFIVVAGLVQITRAYAADVVLFFGAAGLLVWDAGRSPGLGLVPRPPVASVRARAAMAFSAVGYGAVVSWVPRNAPALHVAFAAPGLVVLWALLNRPTPQVGAADPGAGLPGQHAARACLGRTGARGRDVARPALDGDDSALTSSLGAGLANREDLPAGPGWLVWPALGLLLAFIELVSFLSQPDARTDNPSHPTVSTVVEPWLDNQAARALTLAVWLAMGWWLFRRLGTWAARQ